MSDPLEPTSPVEPASSTEAPAPIEPATSVEPEPAASVEVSAPIEPISAEQARALLEQAISQRLGDDWREEDSGWQMVTGHDYMARMTRGRKNVDFYVDLLGNVTVTESQINAAQDTGRVLAWMFLGLSIAIAFLVARIVGWV